MGLRVKGNLKRCLSFVRPQCPRFLTGVVLIWSISCLFTLTYQSSIVIVFFFCFFFFCLFFSFYHLLPPINFHPIHKISSILSATLFFFFRYRVFGFTPHRPRLFLLVQRLHPPRGLTSLMGGWS